MKGFQSCTRNFWNNRRREDATYSSDHKVVEETYTVTEKILAFYTYFNVIQ